MNKRDQLVSLVDQLRATSLRERPSSALHVCIRALPIARELADREKILVILCVSARANYLQGNRLEAFVVAEEALTLSRELGRIHEEIELRTLLASLCDALFQRQTAMEHREIAILLADRLRDIATSATLFARLAEDALARREVEQARSLSSRGLRLTDFLPNVPARVDQLLVEASIALAMGEVERVQEIAADLKAQVAESKSNALEARLRLVNASVAAIQGDYDAALRHLHGVASGLDDMGMHLLARRMRQMQLELMCSANQLPLPFRESLQDWRISEAAEAERSARQTGQFVQRARHWKLAAEQASVVRNQLLTAELQNAVNSIMHDKRPQRPSDPNTLGIASVLGSLEQLIACPTAMRPLCILRVEILGPTSELGAPHTEIAVIRDIAAAMPKNFKQVAESRRVRYFLISKFGHHRAQELVEQCRRLLSIDPTSTTEPLVEPESPRAHTGAVVSTLVLPRKSKATAVVVLDKLIRLAADHRRIGATHVARAFRMR